MNKIKLLYDVVKTIKAKEVLTGMLKAEVEKDQVIVFSLQNEFEKNLSTGQTKAKVNAELNCEGQTVKHEHNTVFSMPFPPERKHHEFWRHIHHSHGGICEGLKGRLAKFAFALSVLDTLKAEEREDKSIVISLNANDLPADMKLLLREKMNQAGACHRHGHGFMQEFCTVDKLDLLFTMFISKNYEIEKIVITAGGTQTDEQAKQHNLQARAELSLVG